MIIKETISSESVIELKELRIGNILSYKGEYVHVTMLSIDADDEYEDTIGFCKLGRNTNEHVDWNRALANDLNRVLLTPEILEKCGFKNRSQTTDYLFEHPKLMLAGTMKRFFPSVWGESGPDGYGNEIKFLHQLQNLYFALTGEELQIKDLT